MSGLDPLDYPGVPVETAGLLGENPSGPARTPGAPRVRQMRATDGGFEVADAAGWKALEQVLAAAGSPGLGVRTPVVAVGSNGSPAVMARKLREAGVSLVLPMARCQVTGIAVGHSAHVSVRGYVAAAPYARGGVVTSMVLSWLDRAQLAALDATEPNYRRIRLDAARYPIAIAGMVAPETFDIYESIHGVVALDGAPIELTSQTLLHAALSGVPLLADLVPWAEPHAAVLALADPQTRRRVRELLAHAGHAVPSGLVASAGV